MELVPFLMQGLVMAVDEFYFHHRRELRRWERLGHPLDTLIFALCFGFLLANEPEFANLYAYGALSVFSCLFVTKDEWEHRLLSSAFENWLHALLFILHPTVLIWAGYLWWTRVQTQALQIVFMGAVVFAIYQFAYWNIKRKDG